MIRTAIVFSSSQIDLIQIDPESKKLIFANSKLLPNEAIARGQIINKEQVKVVLEELLKKIPKKQDNLVLVIPEDAVVSKTLTLPKLKREEINEAVQFAAEEYLPFKLEAAVLDWKMIEQKEQMHILFQAVEKTVVGAYVEVVSCLGYEVGVVETPALAMVQMCDCSKQRCQILIHAGIKETVLTLVRGCEVIATSVVNQSTKYNETITRTVSNMISYYKDFEVTSILIGGLGLNQSLVKQLSTLHLPIGGFNLPITTAPSIANTYLLGISAAVRDIMPPSDQRSINLLPLDIVSKQVDKSFKNALSFAVWFLLVGSIIIFSALLSTFVWMQNELKSLENQKKSQISAQAKTIETANLTNSLANKVIQLSANDQFPLELINTINLMQKKGVKILQINMRLAEKKGDIVGLADNRDSLLNFKKALENTEGITVVNLPASSFVEEKQIQFQLNFGLNDKKQINK